MLVPFNLFVFYIISFFPFQVLILAKSIICSSFLPIFITSVTSGFIPSFSFIKLWTFIKSVFKFGTFNYFILPLSAFVLLIYFMLQSQNFLFQCFLFMFRHLFHFNISAFEYSSFSSSCPFLASSIICCFISSNIILIISISCDVSLSICFLSKLGYLMTFLLFLKANNCVSHLSKSFGVSSLLFFLASSSSSEMI